jgi:phosphate transport system substrate-binding protein
MLKKLVVAAVATLIVGAGAAQAADLTGAGATFPTPVYSRWAEAYKAKTGIALNYQSIGSGAGIKQIKAKTVDFGASDKPLPLDAPAGKDSLNAIGLYQFPTVVGGIVPVVNIPGVAPGQLKLTGPVLADIYLGNITKWTAPQIARLNPGLKLPNLPITVVHRSDASGTTFLFTSYLKLVSPTWDKEVGANDDVKWKVGIGGAKNDGVAAFVRQTVGSIGYVEYVYSKPSKMTTVLLQNKAGVFVAATAPAFSAATAGADWSKAPGNFLLLLNQTGPKAWPITGATFILVYKKQANAAAGASVLKFFDWAYKDGDKIASDLDYVPLPPAVKTMIRRQWAAEVTGPDGKSVYVSH